MNFTARIFNSLSQVYKKTCQAVYSIALSENSDEDILSVLNQTGSVISISCYEMTMADLKVIRTKLETPNNGVNTLLLTYTDIGSSGTQEIAEALKNPNNTLKNLYLANNKMNDLGAKAIGHALKHRNNDITTLDLASNNITSFGVKVVARGIKDCNNKVSMLSLGNNPVEYNGALAIAKALQDSDNHVKKLMLYNSSLGDKGLIAIAQALKHQDNKVEFLHLSQNMIKESKSAVILQNALKHPNNKVKELSLSHNKIGDRYIEIIASALQDSNNKVTKLSLSHNEIGSNGAKAIVNAMKDSDNKLSTLDLSHNRIDDTGAEAIADGLKDCSHKIVKLSLSNNIIGDAGALAIANVVKNSNHTFAELDLRNNNITPDVTTEIVGLLCSKISILYLDKNLVQSQNLMATNSCTKSIDRNKREIGDQKFKTILQQSNSDSSFVEGIKSFNDNTISNISKSNLVTANSNVSKKVSDDYTSYIIRGGNSSSSALNNLAVSFDGIDHSAHTINSVNSSLVDSNLILGKLLMYNFLYNKNKSFSTKIDGVYSSPQQEREIAIDELASRILPVLQKESVSLAYTSQIEKVENGDYHLSESEMLLNDTVSMLGTL